jgi:hypothetical protein
VESGVLGQLPFEIRNRVHPARGQTFYFFFAFVAACPVVADMLFDAPLEDLAWA